MMNQMVVFLLEGQQYAVNISQAQEIIRIPEITLVPESPPWVKGIMNLRGKVIPVMDLRKRFGFGDSENQEECRLLVLEWEGMVLSVIVDDVLEVIHLDDGDIEPVISSFGGLTDNFLRGIGVIENRMVLILDVKRIMDQSFIQV